MRHSALILITLLLYHHNTHAVAPTTGLVGFYPFTGNALDVGPQANHGTASGPVLTFDRYGQANAAYDFDGINDVITIPHHSSHATPSFSVSLWFNTGRDDASATPTWEIVSKNPGPSASTGTFSLFAHNPAITPGKKGHIQGRVGSGTTTASTQSIGADGRSWHQAIIVFDNTANQLIYYLDGRRVSMTPVAFNPTHNTAPLRIGGWPKGGSYFNGQIDDVRLYALALSSADAKLLYAAESPPPSTKPPVTIKPPTLRGSVPIGGLYDVKLEMPLYFLHHVQDADGTEDLIGFIAQNRSTALTDTADISTYLEFAVPTPHTADRNYSRQDNRPLFTNITLDQVRRMRIKINARWKDDEGSLAPRVFHCVECSMSQGEMQILDVIQDEEAQKSIDALATSGPIGIPHALRFRVYPQEGGGWEPWFGTTLYENGDSNDGWLRFRWQVWVTRKQ